MVRINQMKGIRDGFSNPEPFFGHGEPLWKQTEFGVAVAQRGSRGRRDKVRRAKAFVAEFAMEHRDILLEALDGLGIVSGIAIGLTKDKIRPGLETDMPERCRQGQDTLAVVDGTVDIAPHPEIASHRGVDPPKALLIAQRLRKVLSTMQMVEQLRRRCSQRIPRIIEAKLEVNGLLGSGTTLGELRQGCQRLLKIRHSFAVRGAGFRAHPGLPAVG
jgi:hypothetical protein